MEKRKPIIICLLLLCVSLFCCVYALGNIYIDGVDYGSGDNVQVTVVNGEVHVKNNNIDINDQRYNDTTVVGISDNLAKHQMLTGALVVLLIFIMVIVSYGFFKLMHRLFRKKPEPEGTCIPIDKGTHNGN